VIKTTTILKNLINSKKLEFFLEAHNGISASIVQEAGFSGIWASGLSIAASLGVRDSNEASWTQVLEILEFMSDSTSIPILADADSGYGNFNNVRRLVKKLEQRGIAGMCIEDKEFPKKNSFINSESQYLVSIDEFVGKIQAAKDTQIDPDFCVIARTEAIITTQNIDEALLRCQAYYHAGADALVIHSKRQDPSDIITFMKQWHYDCPIIIIPTTYMDTPTSLFESLNISLVLWANHMLRASVYQMKKIAALIFANSSVLEADKKIASLEEIFRFQKVQELEEAEKIYLSHPSYKC